MALFRVVNVVDGDTFDVASWQWEGQTGTRVRPTGYDAPELPLPPGQTAKRKLTDLILGKDVELREAYRVDRGRLVCDVYFNGVYLAHYFSD
jgi:endonuclease YncB( thermonuclease family)